MNCWQTWTSTLHPALAPRIPTPTPRGPIPGARQWLSWHPLLGSPLAQCLRWFDCILILKQENTPAMPWLPSESGLRNPAQRRGQLRRPDAPPPAWLPYKTVQCPLCKRANLQQGKQDSPAKVLALQRTQFHLRPWSSLGPVADPVLRPRSGHGLFVQPVPTLKRRSSMAWRPKSAATPGLVPARPRKSPAGPPLGLA